MLDVNSDTNLIFMVNEVMYRWILYLWLQKKKKENMYEKEKSLPTFAPQNWS